MQSASAFIDPSFNGAFPNAAASPAPVYGGGDTMGGQGQGQGAATYGAPGQAQAPQHKKHNLNPWVAIGAMGATTLGALALVASHGKVWGKAKTAAPATKQTGSAKQTKPRQATRPPTQAEPQRNQTREGPEMDYGSDADDDFLQHMRHYEHEHEQQHHVGAGPDHDDQHMHHGDNQYGMSDTGHDYAAHDDFGNYDSGDFN